ncbi:MAG: hypothetical protein QOH09_4651 [Pseudonocardiales bacterium]|jgi:hypothetical protein|nr:hypothetical protein [Pseudonocardiales bacterium]
MPVISGPPRAVYATAVETLAGSVVRALTGADDAFQLAGQLVAEGSPAECRARLAAVRVLGPDALAPFALAGHQFGPEDAEVVETGSQMFPTSELDPDATDDADNTVLVRALRDWATGEVLTRLGVAGSARAYPARRGASVGPDQGWLAWGGVLAQLSPLATPGLDGPLHADARRYRLDVARGVTRAMLRRDYLTAARLARWLASGGEVTMDPPFAVEPVLRQLELVAGADPRLQLEIAIARYGLGGGAGE